MRAAYFGCIDWRGAWSEKVLGRQRVVGHAQCLEKVSTLLLIAFVLFRIVARACRLRRFSLNGACADRF